jgi:hypothetical protein
VARRRLIRLTAGGLVAAGFSLIAAQYPPFTGPARVLTFVAGALTLGAAVLHRRRPKVQREQLLTGAVAWAVVLGAMACWEIANLFVGPRPSHPTLSSLIEARLTGAVPRFFAYFGWLGLGWTLVNR